MAKIWANRASKPMPKMWLQLLLVVFFAAMIIWIAGGTMVQAVTAEQSRQSDFFVGFHIVVGERNQDRSQWVEYGQTEIELSSEFGAIQIPDMVLFGEYQEETGEWIFPGMPGNNAFCTVVDVGEDGLSTGYAGLHADVEIAFSANSMPNYFHALEDSDANLTSMVDDTRDSISLSGTVYLPASSAGQLVTYYRVYETVDGRIYLDGSGNSSSSNGTSGFGMGSSEEEVVTTNGGECYTVSTEVWVDVEYVHPCVSLLLLEYNAQNECIATTSLTLQEQTVPLNAKTIWCVVEETDAAGQTRHTALSVADASEDDILYHGFVTQTSDDVMVSNHLEIVVP